MGGTIIIGNDAVKKAVSDPTVYSLLPAACKLQVDAICAKGLAQWTDGDFSYMVSMLFVARHC